MKLRTHKTFQGINKSWSPGLTVVCIGFFLIGLGLYAAFTANGNPQNFHSAGIVSILGFWVVFCGSMIYAFRF